MSKDKTSWWILRGLELADLRWQRTSLRPRAPAWLLRASSCLACHLLQMLWTQMPDKSAIKSFSSHRFQKCERPASRVSAREWSAGPCTCVNPSHNEGFNMKHWHLCMNDVWKCTFAFANVGLTFSSVGLAYGLKVWVLWPKSFRFKQQACSWRATILQSLVSILIKHTRTS